MFKQTFVGSRKEQYSKYVNVVLIERKISIHNAIKTKQQEVVNTNNEK